MKIEDFITEFAEQFDETDSNSIKSDTEFKNLDEWDSMIAMGVIGMADTVFGAKLTGDDIRNSKTVSDLYNLVLIKK